MKYFALLLIICACSQAVHESSSTIGNNSYAMDLFVSGTANQISNLSIAIHDENNNPPNLVVDHERILHVIAVDETFTHFMHIHPEDYGPLTTELITANFTLHPIFPSGGKYLIAVDFAAPEPASLTKIVSVSGAQASRQTFSPSPLQQFDEYIVNMVPQQIIRAREPAEIEFHIGTKNGPVFDLEPYLGAPMHFTIIKDDLSVFMHVHGAIPAQIHGASLHSGEHSTEAAEKFGPTISLLTTFPEPGIYHVFGEFKQGSVILIHYVVEVGPPQQPV